MKITGMTSSAATITGQVKKLSTRSERSFIEPKNARRAAS
jgi:hypothetical protein